MPGRTQAKLLRALEQGTIERVGGEREQAVDVRILAATNISLEQAVSARRFRADLYHRLSVFRIHVPPLRERLEDLPLLVDHFLDLLSRRYGRRVRLTPEAMRLLQEYHWPGNIRELRNVLERVLVETQGPVIGRNAFSEWVRERDFLTAGGWNLDQLRALAPVLITPRQSEGGPRSEDDPPRLQDPMEWAARQAAQNPQFPLARIPGTALPQSAQTVDAIFKVLKPGSRKPLELTEDTIRKAYAQARGNATKAAALLGVHKATLYRKMKSLGLTREALERSALG
jgi:DNA-binding NtrC family response regulator